MVQNFSTFAEYNKVYRVTKQCNRVTKQSNKKCKIMKLAKSKHMPEITFSLQLWTYFLK